MLIAGDDDRCLAIAEGYDPIHGVLVGRQIDQLVADALGIKGARGCGALYAGGHGIDNDCHGGFLFVRGPQPPALPDGYSPLPVGMMATRSAARLVS